MLIGLLITVACNPDDDSTNKKPNNSKPTVGIEIIETTCSSVVFEVSVNTPGEIGYLVANEQLEAPEVIEWFGYNKAEVKDSKVFTVENLIDDSDYVIYVVLRSSDNGALSAPKTQKFTTPDDGVANPITINSTTYNSVNFTIDLAGDFIFQVIDDDYLKLMQQTAEEFLATPGIGIPAKNKTTVDWIDKSSYGTYACNLRSNTDYNIVAANATLQSDGSMAITGEVFIKKFRSPAAPVSNAGITIEINNITSTSVDITTTPDENVASYLVSVFAVHGVDHPTGKGRDEILEMFGEEMLIRAIERYYENDGVGWPNLTGVNEKTWGELKPNVEYAVCVVVTDNEGLKAISMLDFKTLAASDNAPVVDLTISTPKENGHTTINVNMLSRNAKYVNVVVAPTADAQGWRKSGMSDTEIANTLGTAIDAKYVEAMRTTGYTLIVEDLWRDTEYTIFVSVKNAEQTETVLTRTHKTEKAPVEPRVESDLFTKLLGEWNVTYTVLNRNNITATIENQKVTIAQGVDEASEIEYRNQNRLVITGWPFSISSLGTFEPQNFYTPEQLIDQRPNYYEGHHSLAYRDYGPKIFLHIGEGDVITVPSSRGEYFYNWSDNGVFYFFGTDLEKGQSAPASFPVTLSADGNTLTIGALQSGEEFFFGNYRPSVWLDNNGMMMWSTATTDIVLTRVK